MTDAMQLIRSDHQRIQDLFREFENSEDSRDKKRIADQVIFELEVHAKMEEEVFYPAMKKQLGDVDLLHEANEEHHVAELLMDELKGMKQANKQFNAKFTVLMENVKHHIQEEESEILPKAAEAGREELQQLGEKLQERQLQLMEEVASGTKRRATKKPAAKKSTRARDNGRSSGRTARTTARTTRAGSSARGSRTASSGGRARTTRTTARTTRTTTRSPGSGRAAKTTTTRTTKTTARKTATRSAASRSRSESPSARKRTASKSGGSSRKRS